MNRRRLLNADYTATRAPDSPTTTDKNGQILVWDGDAIALRWRSICDAFVASIPADIDLSDVTHLCAGALEHAIARRIVLDRQEERRRQREADRVRGAGWLRAIEALKAGEWCEFKNNDAVWVAAVVLENGGAGLWRVKLADGRVVHPYIENVRCPGQTEAWTW